MDIRVGIGQDSHKFEVGKKCVLGGVEIPDCEGFSANSDGDVVIHAICIAIEQALGNTSFSIYSDDMCKKGITDSKEYLKVAKKHLKDKGYRINNIGISIEAKKPKILPIEDAMKDMLSLILDINKDKVGISATTGEGLTSFGRGLGVQVFVIVSIINI